MFETQTIYRDMFAGTAYAAVYLRRLLRDLGADPVKYNFNLEESAKQFLKQEGLCLPRSKRERVPLVLAGPVR